MEPKEPALALDASKGEFHLTALRTLGTLRTMSASRRGPNVAFPTWHDHNAGLLWSSFQNMRQRSRVQSRANEIDLEIEAAYQRREQAQ